MNHAEPVKKNEITEIDYQLIMLRFGKTWDEMGQILAIFRGDLFQEILVLEQK